MARYLLLAAALSTASAAQLTGFISDAACGWNNARATKEAKECAQKCVKGGWEPVFVRDGDVNTYRVSNQKLVLPFVGDHVTVTGELTKDTLVLTKIQKSPPPTLKK